MKTLKDVKELFDLAKKKVRKENKEVKDALIEAYNEIEKTEE